MIFWELTTYEFYYQVYENVTFILTNIELTNSEIQL